MADNTFKRLEKKIIFPKEKADELKARIEEYMLPDKHCIGGNYYTVCNLYFDDDFDDVIRVSVERPVFKEKLRLRSYGIPEDNSKVFLEIKKKFDGIGTKRRTNFTLSQAKEYLATGNHPEGLKYIDEQVLREIDYYREHHPVEPKVYLSYKRFAYFGKDDPDFRITFDFDIIARRYDLSLEAGRYGEQVLPDDKMLLEVKFIGAVPLWFAHIMSQYGLSFNPFSKYGTHYRRNAYQKAFGDK